MWIKALPLEELPVGAARTVKHEGKQLALFRVAADQVHAIDNRCPHEGYPLATGALAEGVLTCEWHNWKFRLCDGACLLGGEDVRSYPVRIEEGVVQVDLTEPSRGAEVPRLVRALTEGVDERDWGRVGRTIERMLLAGMRSEEILGVGCDLAAARGPYGVDHGPATAADLAALIAEVPEDADLLLLEALNLLLDDHARRAVRPAAEAERVDPAIDHDSELRRRIEAEDLAGAEALVAGAVEAGVPAESLFRWLTHAATDHFLDYGHAHIYVVKLEELLARIGWSHARPVLVGLVAMIVYATREDRLPYMRKYAVAMAPYAERFPAWWSARGDEELDVEPFVATVLDGELADALGAVARALDARVAPRRIALGLAAAAAHRILRFDPAIEASDELAEGWLSVTHALTHADAVHETLLRRGDAEALRALFHSARFIQHLAPLDLPPERREAVAGAVDASALCRRAARDLATVPIFVDHHIKTSFAARRLGRALAAEPRLTPFGDLPVHAAARFLAHPLRERRIARNGLVARAFVRTGHRQRALLGYT